MQPESCDIGLIGLAVMGQNLVLNMNDHGYKVAVFNRTVSKVDDFIQHEAAGTQVVGAHSIEELIGALKRPRRVMMMVKAGDTVDQVIDELTPHLEKGDIIIDGGNSHYPDTNRRTRDLAAKGILFVGTGVSGGEEGARHGPSIMPGGNPAAWPHVKEIFQSIAAKVEDGTPCCDWVGEEGAGHYVKMVHNGIEYGDMQLIAEAYDVLKSIGGLSNVELADTFSEWNAGELQSFLIEITANIFRKKDPDTGKDLVDLIVDAAAAKGTGKWTVQDAAEIGAPVPTVASSVEARLISSDRAGRAAASKLLVGPSGPSGSVDKKKLISDVRAALYAAKACSYAQGMNLLRAASNLRNWGINLGELARIWKGGCIIRAQFLGRIKEAYDRDANLPNLLIDPGFRKELAERQNGWRSTVTQAINAGVPVMTMGGSLGYYDSIRREHLPANLTQAQRDYFGAHTYERLDKPGTFHTEWFAK